MKFAEFHAGQVIEAGPHTPTADEIVVFARQWDPQWFHVDAARAADGRFGGLIASGWHTCAIAMRLLADQALAGSESFASPGIERIRWPNPVRPGAPLRVRATVLETRTARSRASLGILVWRWQMWQGAGERGFEVLDLEATSLFDLARPTPAGTGPTTPDAAPLPSSSS